MSLTEDEESEKELNKSQIEDIVHTSKSTIPEQDTQTSELSVETVEVEEDEEELEERKHEQSEGDIEEEQQKTVPSEEETSTTTWTTTTESKESITTTEETFEVSYTTNEIKNELNTNLAVELDGSEHTVITTELSDNLYDDEDVVMEKENSIKRDYSRTKKKDANGELIF